MAIDRKARIGIEVVGEGEEDAAKKAAEALEAMETAGKRAGETMEKAGEKIARGAGGAERSVIQAKGALDEYVRSLQAAEGAGAVIGEAEMAKLHDLEGAYQQATAEVGEFRAAQEQAKRDIESATEAAGGQAPAIRNLSDVYREVTKELGPGAVKWGTWGAAAAGAFTVGWQAGTKLREVLDEISGGKFSEGIQRDLTNWLRLDQGINTVAEDAELLRNQLNILVKSGIDPTGLSAEQVGAKVEELGKKMQAASIQASAAAHGFQEMRKELEAQAQELVARVELITNATKELGGERQAQIIRDTLGVSIKEALDLYAQLGQTVPQEIQKIADSLGVLSSSAEEARQRHVEVVRAILTDIKGEIAKTRPEIEAEAKALAQAIPDAFAAMPPVNFLSPEQFENAQVVISQMINTFKQAGQAIPPELEKMASAVGVLNTAIAGVNPQPLIDLAARLGAELRNLQADAMAAAGAVKKVFIDPLAAGDTQTEELDPGDGSWVTVR